MNQNNSTDAPSPKSHKTTFVNGIVLTMDEKDQIAEAVTIEGERIVAVGTTEEMTALTDDNTSVIDLMGRTLMPGFVDAHSHFPQSGRIALKRVDVPSPPRGDFNSIDRIVAAMKAKAATTPKGEWVIGVGYEDAQLKEMRHPTREDLDRVSTEHPVWLVHCSFHMGVANSLAIDMAGVTKDTECGKGGVIRKDPETGEVAGLFEEFPAMQFIGKMIPPFSAAEDREAVLIAAQQYLSGGVTSAQNSFSDKSIIETVTAAADEDVLPIRVVLFPEWEIALEIKKGNYTVKDTDPNKVQLGAAKLFSDGSLPGYSAYLSEPYYFDKGQGPDYRGYPQYSRERLAEIINELHCGDHQIAIHVNGDAALDDVLDAFEDVQKRHPRDDCRHQVIHIQTAREDQFDRLKKLDITVTFLTPHIYYWGDVFKKYVLGPERTARVNPVNSAARRGIPFTLHCDTPVTPMTPLFAAWAAVNRITPDGQVSGEDQRITALEAMRGITIEAAWQVFRENEIGSIEPGKLADFVILSENPLDNPLTIRDIKIEETILGGQSVYQR